MFRTLLVLGLSTVSAATISAQSPVVEECRRAPADTIPSPSVAQAIAQAGGASARIAAAVRLCGDSSKWLALADLPARDLGQDRGWRFVLLVDSAGSPSVRHLTQGMLDSYATDFRLFRSGVEYLLLADEGDEGGSWGIATFDVGPFLIVSLGHLDVGRPADADMENDQSALEDALVRRTLGGWQIEFLGPLVLRPNQDSRKVLSKPKTGTLIFRPGGDWHLSR